MGEVTQAVRSALKNAYERDPRIDDVEVCSVSGTVYFEFEGKQFKMVIETNEQDHHRKGQ